MNPVSLGVELEVVGLEAVLVFPFSRVWRLRCVRRFAGTWAMLSRRNVVDCVRRSEFAAGCLDVCNQCIPRLCLTMSQN